MPRARSVPLVVVGPWAGRRAFAVTVSVLVGLVGPASRPARAAADEGAAAAGREVRVEAEGACADAARFEGAVRARSARVRIRPDAVDRVSLRTRETPEGAEGELEVVRDGSPVVRRVAGARCDEVVSGLAFVAALAFDPDARVQEPDAPTLPPATPAAPAVDTARAPRDARTGGARLRPEVVARAHATGLGFDGPGLGAALEVGVRLGRGEAPATARLGGTVTVGGSEVAPARADARLLAARLELCTPGLGALGLALHACAAGLVGSLRVAAAGVAEAVSGARAFGAVEAALRVGAPLTRWLTVELSPGVLVPLVRDRYLVERLGLLYRAPVAAPALSLGVGGHFP